MFAMIRAYFQLTFSPQAAVNDCMKHAGITICSYCKKGCATIKCSHVNECGEESCTARYHLTCATSDRALLHHEWFLLLCPQHRPGSVVKAAKALDTVVICHFGPTPELISRLEGGDETVRILFNLDLRLSRYSRAHRSAKSKSANQSAHGKMEGGSATCFMRFEGISWCIGLIFKDAC